jgi:hypothetical protein
VAASADSVSLPRTIEGEGAVHFSRRRGSRFAAAAAALAAVAVASTAPAIGPDGESVGDRDRQRPAAVTFAEVGAAALDIAVLRPLGAVASVAGFAFFLASTPLVAPSGRIGTIGDRIGRTWDVFVLAPVDYTFRRPLGDF